MTKLLPFPNLLQTSKRPLHKRPNLGGGSFLPLFKIYNSMKKYTIYYKGTNRKVLTGYNTNFVSPEAAQRYIDEYAIFPQDYEIKEVEVI